MSQLAEGAFWSATLAGGLRLATPLIYASIGETFAQRSGVLNIGLEGYMIVGALTSLYIADPTVGPLGFLVGGLAGMALAAVMMALSVRLFANQVVVGFGLTILGTYPNIAIQTGALAGIVLKGGSGWPAGFVGHVDELHIQAAGTPGFDIIYDLETIVPVELQSFTIE